MKKNIKDCDRVEKWKECSVHTLQALLFFDSEMKLAGERGMSCCHRRQHFCDKFQEVCVF